VTATLPVQGSSWPLVFSPDASRLALVTTEPAGTHLLLVDGTTGELLARRSVPFSPSTMEFTPDGTSLVLYGTPEGSQPGITQPEPPGVLLLDAANLDLLWEHTLDGVLSGFWCIEDCDAPHGEPLFAMWSPAVVLSADHRTRYVVHADDDTLTTVDFAARSASSVRIHVARSWLDTLMGMLAGVAEAKAPIDGASKVGALAPDGHTLYVVGHSMHSERSEQGGWQMSQESFGLQSIDVQTGQRVSSIPAEASNLRMSPDGQFLFLEGTGEPGASTQILDARTLEPLARLARWEPLLGQRLGGDPILLAVRYGETTTELAVLDTETFEVIDTWRPDGHAIWLVPH
ncbi:MAG TPA: hypothetical protein VER55_03730, partial [Ardenticatenaceae bacterium]|nr:hypothetical protein [Ardenticatenaceae bacterium]